MTTKYYFLSKPPGIGCQPEGFIETESWLPRQHPENFPRGAFGWVTYPKPLIFEQIWVHDLFPIEIVEKTVYLAWLESSQNLLATIEYLQVFWVLQKTTLKQLAKEQVFTAADVLACQEVGKTWQDVSRVIAAGLPNK